MMVNEFRMSLGVTIDNFCDLLTHNKLNTILNTNNKLKYCCSIMISKQPAPQPGTRNKHKSHAGVNVYIIFLQHNQA